MVDWDEMLKRAQEVLRLTRQAHDAAAKGPCFRALWPIYAPLIKAAPGRSPGPRCMGADKQLRMRLDPAQMCGACAACWHAEHAERAARDALSELEDRFADAGASPRERADGA